MSNEKRSDKWPKSHRASEKKWKKIEEKVEARERFRSSGGFANLEVWTTCGYCDEFGDRCSSLYPCWVCPLNLRLAKWEGSLIPICDSCLGTPSIISAFVRAMRESHPDMENALKLVKIIREQIAKDKPQIIEVQPQ